MAIAAAEYVYFAWREHPTGQDILALWLDHSRSMDNCVHVTRELLTVYPSLVNQKVLSHASLHLRPGSDNVLADSVMT